LVGKRRGQSLSKEERKKERRKSAGGAIKKASNPKEIQVQDQ